MIKRTIAAAALTFASAGAAAQTTYEVPLYGSAVLWQDPCLANPSGPACEPQISWTGALTVTLPSAADGLYLAPDATIVVDLSNTFVDFDASYGTSAVVADGKLVSVDFGSGYTGYGWFINNSFYWNAQDSHESEVINASPVSELPATSMLLCGAFALIALRRRPG